MSQPGDGDPPKTFGDDLNAWLRQRANDFRSLLAGLVGNTSPDVDGRASKSPRELASPGRRENESEIAGARVFFLLILIGLVPIFAQNLLEPGQPDSMDLYVTRLSQSYAGPDVDSQKLERIPRGRHVPPGEKRVDGWRRLNRERAYIRAANLSPVPRPTVKVWKAGSYLNVGKPCDASGEADGSDPTVLKPGLYRIYGTVTDPGVGKGKYEILLPKEGVVYVKKGICVPPAEPPPTEPPVETPPVVEPPVETGPPEKTPHIETRAPAPAAVDDTVKDDRPAYVAELEESGLQTLQPRHIRLKPSPDDLVFPDPDGGPTVLVVARCRIALEFWRGWTVRQCNVLGSEEHREKYKATVRRLSIKFVLNGRALGRSGIKDLDNVLVRFLFRNPAYRRPPTADGTATREKPDADGNPGVDQGDQ